MPEEISDDGLRWFDFEPRPGQRVALYAEYNKFGQLRAWQLVTAFQERISHAKTRLDMVDALDELVGSMAVLVADWDLKDAQGNPLSKPADNPGAFDDLSTGAEGEMSHLISLIGRYL